MYDIAMVDLPELPMAALPIERVAMLPDLINRVS